MHKVYMLRFLNFRPTHSCTCTYAFSMHLPPLSTNIQVLFLKEDMTDKFSELLSIKEPQRMLQNKEITLQSYHKMSNQNTKKSCGIEFLLLILAI